MPYDTDNRSGITKNASESQKKSRFLGEIFLFIPQRAPFFWAHLQKLGDVIKIISSHS